MFKRLSTFWLDISIVRKGLAIALIFMACLMIMTVCSINLQNNIESAHGWVLHTETVRRAGLRLFNSLQESEISLRTYAITQRKDSLARHIQSMSRVPSLLKELRGLVHDNPLQSKRLFEIESVIGTQSKEMAAQLSLMAGNPGKRIQWENLQELVVKGDARSQDIRLRLVSPS